MAKTLITIRVDDEVLEAFEKLAAQQGCSRSELMHDSLERGLSGEERFQRVASAPVLQQALVAAFTAGPVVEAVAKKLGIPSRLSIPKKN